MITGQSYDKVIEITTSPDYVHLKNREDSDYSFTGEAAIKLGHDLIAAGEKVLKKSGDIHEE